MPIAEWWFRYGWYDLGVEEYLFVLLLAATWIVVAADCFTFHRTRDRRGRGVLVALPILIWVLFGCRQAVNAMQLDMAGHYSRYSYFWSCIVASALVGVVVAGCTLATDRLLAAPGPYHGPCRAVIRCNTIALTGWFAVWLAVFAHEASL